MADRAHAPISWLPGQPLLLPITNSLYVNGKISNNGKVLVDVGTGYYVEVRQGHASVKESRA